MGDLHCWAMVFMYTMRLVVHVEVVEAARIIVYTDKAIQYPFRCDVNCENAVVGGKQSAEMQHVGHHSSHRSLVALFVLSRHNRSVTVLKSSERDMAAKAATFSSSRAAFLSASPFGSVTPGGSSTM